MIKQTASIILMTAWLAACTSATPVLGTAAESGTESGAQSARPAQPAQEPLDGAWRLTEVGGQAVDLPEATIQFDAASLGVSATAGCNRIFGRYHLHEGRLTFSPPASTRMACADAGQVRLETALGRALAGAAGGRYRIDGDELVIENREGAAVLKARR